MNEWMTPQGITAIIAVLTTVILPLIVHVLNLAGKKDLAAKLDQVKTHAEVAEKALTTVVKGVNNYKKTLGPSEVLNLTQMLRKENEAAGVEEVIKPIVKEELPPAAAIERVTARLTRKVS